MTLVFVVDVNVLLTISSYSGSGIAYLHIFVEEIVAFYY